MLEVTSEFLSSCGVFAWNAVEPLNHLFVAARSGFDAFRNRPLPEEHVSCTRTPITGPGARIGDDPFPPRPMGKPLHDLPFQNRF